MDALHQLEIYLILWIQSVGAWFVVPMNAITQLGSEELFILLMPTFYWCIDSSLGLQMAVMLLLSNGINCILKLAFQSPRPYWFDPRIRAYSVETSFGMPSAHAQNAMSVWGLLAIGLRSKWMRGLIALMIFLIGFSRIILGMHFISDIILGWLAGGVLLWAFTCFEGAVIRWLKTLNFGSMAALALGTSILIASAVLLTAASLAGWTASVEWIQNVRQALPNNPIDPLNIDGAATFAGTWLGMLLGAAWLYYRQGGFQASGSLTQRLLRYGIGITGLLILYLGLGKIFPRDPDAVSFILRYFRYALIGLWVSALAPLLFERLGLSQSSDQPLKITVSSGKNIL